MVDNFSIALQFEAAGVPKTVGDVRKITTAVNNIRKENEEAAATARVLAEAYGLSEAEVRQVENAVESLRRRTAGVSDEARGLNGIFQGILQGVGQGIFGAIQGSFQAATQGVQTFLASTLEVGQAARSAEDAFTTFLGSSEEAQATLQELSDFAAQTPFDLPGVRNAGQQLLAFGFQTDELTEQLSRVGNIAAGVQTDFNELAAIYGKARTQGRLFADDINQLTERGIPIIGELAAQFGVTESEVRGLVESGQVGFDNLEQAFVSLTSEGGKFFNLLQTQSGTVVGQISNLGDSFVQLQEQIFRAFEPALAEGLQLVSQTLVEVAQNSEALDILADGGERLREALAANPELAEQLGQALAIAADEGARLVVDALDGIATFLEENPDEIANSIELITSVGLAVADLIGVIGQLISFQAAIGNFLAELFKIEEIIGIVTAVIDRLGVLGAAIKFVADQINRVTSSIDGQDANTFQPYVVSLNQLKDVTESVQAGYEGIRDSQQQTTTETGNLTQAVIAQGRAYEESTRALGLQEQQERATLLSRGANQQELTALEDRFLQERIRLNQQRLAELRNIQESDGVSSEQRASANEEALKLEETLAKQEVDLAQSAADEIKRIAKEKRDAAIEAAKEETDALKQEREEQERIATQGFDTTQRQQADAFDTQQRQSEERFNDRQRTEDRQFQETLQSDQQAFEDNQRAAQRQFDSQQQSQQEAFNNRQRTEEQRFQSALNEERQQGNREFDALEREVQNRIDLAEADTRQARKAVQERIDAEEEAAEIRREVEADVLRQRNSILSDEDTDLSPLEQARADFEAELQAKESEFQAQQQLEAQAFEDTQQLAKQNFEDGQRVAQAAFEDGQRTLKQAFEDRQRTAQAAFEDGQRTLQAAFEDQQRQAEAAFKDNQRSLDEASADRIADILSNARNTGGQSLRSGGVAEGGVVQVHRDEFLVPPRGTRVVSQADSRRLVANYLSGSDRSVSVGAMGGNTAIEKKLDRLIKATEAIRPTSSQATINLGQGATQYDAIQAAFDYQRAKARRL